jgi:monooxygenase
VVFETLPEVSRRPKATTLHARAVQCLVRRGHLPGPARDLQRGRSTTTFHFVGLPGLTLGAPGSEPEPLLKAPQAELERLFEARARAAGARVLREHRVMGLRQGPDGVRVTVEGPRSTTTWSAAYLVGADGARSTVRTLAGIRSETWPATVSAMMGLVRLPDAGILSAGWHRTGGGWIVAKHDADGDTHIRTLDCTGAHTERRRPPTAEELRREMAWSAGRDIPLARPRWLSRFSDFSRLARTYRARRVLLAGDAAHVHFPIGGQGLTTRLLDAVNLCWKLAFTVRGEAGDGLLDTYDQERRPAARQVIDNSRGQLALMRPDPELDALCALFGRLMAADGGEGPLSGMVSAQDTVLPTRTSRPSPWGGRFLHNTELRTRAGRTDVIALLREGRPVLLLLGEEGRRYEEEAGPRATSLRVVHAAPVPGLPWALLVRPDGYIACAPGVAAGRRMRSGFTSAPFRPNDRDARRRTAASRCSRSADADAGRFLYRHGLPAQFQDLVQDLRPAALGEVHGRQDGGLHHAGQQVAQEAAGALHEVLVVAQRLGHGLDARERADHHVGGLGRRDVRQQLALRLSPLQQVPADVAPPQEGPAAVQALGPLVQRQPDAGADHGVGAQSVGVQQHGVDELLHLAGAFRHRQLLVLLAQNALGQVLLRLEVKVQSSLGHACDREDLGDGRRLIAAFLEDLGCRREDRLTCTDGTVLHGHSVSSPLLDVSLNETRTKKPPSSYLTGEGRRTQPSDPSESTGEAQYEWGKTRRGDGPRRQRPGAAKREGRR